MRFYIFAATFPILRYASAITFNPATQRIVVSRPHQFIPPNPSSDYRGPCPGLNALASHGFIPRNGVATIDQLVNASVEIFGMSREQASLAAFYSTPMVVSPDLNTISVGPPLKGVPSNVSLRIPPQGLNFPHISLEFDASPTRLDKYQPESRGNNVDLSMPLFQQLLDLQKNVPDGKVDFDLNVLADHRMQRYLDSTARNPRQFIQPFTGMFLNGNKYSLIYQLFANRSAEHPEGRLDRRTLMSFYGVRYGGKNGKHLVYNKGWERVPENWYRRSRDDQYDLRKSNDDLLAQIRRHPELLEKYGMGGNMGAVNTYRTVSISQLTNGTYSLETIRDGANLSCLGFMASAQLAPLWLRGYYSDVGAVMGWLMARLPPLIAELNCPLLRGQIDARVFSQNFPGFNSSLPNSKIV